MDLDKLVDQQQYDVALQRLNDSKASEDEKLTWLRRQAEAGHVPIQYDLAARLFSRDREESVKWYARGRLARTLDAAECASGSASFGKRVSLDKVAEKVRDEAVANPRQFTKAIEASLEWESKRVGRPSAAWVCGPTAASSGYGLKASDDERRRSREDALRNMTIEAKAVRDFERAVDAGEAMHVEVLDSGAPALLLGYGPPRSGWLDNWRLLFVGKPPSDRNVPNLDKNNHNWAVLMWDTISNRIEPIIWASAIHALCVDNDYVVAVVWEYVGATGKADGQRRPETAEPDQNGNVTWVYEGRYPNLVKNAPRQSGVRQFKDWKMDCTEAPVRPSQADPHMPVGWLRGNDGAVFVPQSASSSAKKVFYRNDGRVFALPLSERASQLPVMFAPWKGAYLFHDGAREPGTSAIVDGSPKHGQEQVVHWLYPDGHVTTVGIPYGMWSGGQVGAARGGLVVAGRRAQSGSGPGFRGLYLLDEQFTASRLIAGEVTLAATSPDGCAVSFSHAAIEDLTSFTQDSRLNPSTMKVISLCKSK